MDTMPVLWHATPKVDRATMAFVSALMTSKWTFEAIYTEVDKTLVGSEDDKMATTWALVRIRDNRRSYAPKA
jgi:hypothetical protein